MVVFNLCFDFFGTGCVA